MTQLTSREGHAIPDIQLINRHNDDWQSIATADLFAGKNVIVFSLPGAFTPTCSSTHLPRFNELAPVFHANGIDDIVCVSVNDAFVMNAWAADQESEHVRLLPDGNGDFTRAMGMLVNKEELGFGERSWRYSMLVKDGVIDKMFIEPQQPGDPFEVSDADTMLNYINPQAKAPEPVSIITKPGCSFCAKAKAALIEVGIPFEEMVLGRDLSLRSLRATSGGETVPQLFASGKHIGDSEQINQWLTERNAV